MTSLTTSKLRREQLPAPASFYKREGLRLSRPSRGWARTTCPFHKGTNKTAFSVNLKTGGFYCFNCGVKGGDLIDFVMLRERLEFKRAAQSLGAWDDHDLTAAERRQLRRERRERDQRRQLEDDIERRRHADMILRRDYLHACERLYVKTNRRLHQVGPNGPESEQCWELQSWLLDEIRTADAEYRRLAGLEQIGSYTSLLWGVPDAR